MQRPQTLRKWQEMPQTLRGWQKMFEYLYGKQNESLTYSKVWLHLMEEAGTLARDLRYEDFEKLPEDLADVFAWLCAFANRYGIDLEETVWNWYPNICPRCGKPKNCTCIGLWPRPEKDLDRLKDHRKRKEKEAFSLKEWEEKFTKIYGTVNRTVSSSGIGFHLMEEIGEVAREIRRVGERKRCKEELADVFAFLIAVVMKVKIENFPEVIWNLYPGVRREERCKREK